MISSDLRPVSRAEPDLKYKRLLSERRENPLPFSFSSYFPSATPLGFRRAASMSFDLVLKSVCEGCGSTSNLYGTGCRHTTLCTTCATAKCAEHARCIHCGTPITKLIREYGVRASASTDKLFYIGRFVTGLPPFSKKKKNAENNWTLQKEGLQGRQVTDAVREKYKNKPWVLEDDTGKHQYQGQIEGAQAATYYLLMLHGKEFLATPAGSWFNFNKIAQYKQLTLEEAEEKMNKRKNNATGYERWMMKAATNGPAVFGGQAVFDVTKGTGVDNGGAVDGNRPSKGKNNTDGDNSDKGEEDEEEENKRKNRLGLNKKGQDDDEDGGHDDDIDLDDEVEKGDDWEHEETFTDDDEAIGDPDPEDLGPEIPAPPEIKQDDEDEDDDNEEEGGLSKSGKELKKLLGKAAGLIGTVGSAPDDDGQIESTAEDDDDDDDENNLSPVLAPKRKDAPKDEHVENTPAKTASSGSARSTPSTSKSSKGKRKAGSGDVKNANATPAKKMKSDNEPKLSSVKEDQPSSKVIVTPKSSSSTSSRAEQPPPAGPVTEDEIRRVLSQKSPMTTQDLVAKFKTRLKCPKDKIAFTEALKKISKIQKNNNGQGHVVLKVRQ